MEIRKAKNGENKGLTPLLPRPNTIVTVGADGSFLVSKFAEGGECERLSFAKFIRSPDDDNDSAPWSPNGDTPPSAPGSKATADSTKADPPKPPPAP